MSSWDFSDGGGGPNAPQMIYSTDARSGLEIGTVEAGFEGRFGCGGARGPNSQWKSQHKK
jgi:hypothetical protein